MTKQRSHNEHFRTVSLGNRKSCPCCKNKLNGREIWSWGEYRNAKWNTILHFCELCYPTEVKARLNKHTGNCGCTVNLVSYRGETLPEWLKLK